jgi:hypothetical protein
MEFAGVAIWKMHPTSTGKLMAFKLSQSDFACIWNEFMKLVNL